MISACTTSHSFLCTLFFSKRKSWERRHVILWSKLLEILGICTIENRLQPSDPEIVLEHRDNIPRRNFPPSKPRNPPQTVSTAWHCQRDCSHANSAAYSPTQAWQNSSSSAALSKATPAGSPAWLHRLRSMQEMNESTLPFSNNIQAQICSCPARATRRSSSGT